MKKNALSWDYCIRKTLSKQILRIARFSIILLFITVFFVSANDSFSQNEQDTKFFNREAFIINYHQLSSIINH